MKKVPLNCEVCGNRNYNVPKQSNFFQGVKSEMEKTSWPTKEELFKYTVIVVATVVFFLVFFYALDLGIGRIIELIK